MEIRMMYVDENDLEHGIDAVSVVESPAIESSFVALKKEDKEIQLAEVDKKKQILMGALLIPNKPIYRRDESGEYYIMFNKPTVEKCLELMMKRGKQNNTTLEHEVKLNGNTIVEAWIKEDMTHDKSALYGLNDPIGSLMISLKVGDKSQYEEFSKSKIGFSLEGYFTDELKMKKVYTENNKEVEDFRNFLEQLTKS